MTHALTVDKTGRVLLPSAVRRRLNLQPGSRLALELLAERIELTVLPPESAPTTLSPTGRRVLGASGQPSNAARAAPGDDLVAGHLGGDRLAGCR
jgi:AbrB family looped-hinge helix DNA binding protein